VPPNPRGQSRVVGLPEVRACELANPVDLGCRVAFRVALEYVAVEADGRDDRLVVSDAFVDATRARARSRASASATTE
jgi:hypothetical protein